MRSILLLFTALFLLDTYVSAQVPSQPAIPPRECDCPLQRVTDSWCRAQTVFLGTVTAADTVFAQADLGKWDRDGVDHISVGFIVEYTFKGKATAMKNVVTATGTRHCGFSFRKGETFLVFAYDEDGQLATDRCSGTRAADTISRDFSDSLDYIMDGGKYEIAGELEPKCN